MKKHDTIPLTLNYIIIQGTSAYSCVEYFPNILQFIHIFYPIDKRRRDMYERHYNSYNAGILITRINVIITVARIKQ